LVRRVLLLPVDHQALPKLDIGLSNVDSGCPSERQ
jgi:hypothetical protein